MTRWTEPTSEQEQDWREWVAARPPIVRAVAERFEPWSLYSMKSTGHRVCVIGFDENVHVSCSDPNGKRLPVGVRIAVTGEFNLIAFDRQVFGIDPDDLEPCDLPAPGEPLGAALTQEEVDENIDALRVSGRPDLWTMGPDGKAISKQ